MNSVCSKCGKPVYFAERKTSLGKNWHQMCLKCEECGKVLAPGQHAEHKGLPYCHRPCYAACFGPQMVGYGSNVHSSANFRRSGDQGTLYNGKPESLPLKMVFDFSNQKSNTNSNGMNGERNATPTRKASSEERSKFDSETQELLQKIKQFNAYYEGKKRQSLTAISTSGDLLIEGPLRIYWGVNRPIQLQQFDDVPSNLPETNWRHSFIPGAMPSSCPKAEPSNTKQFGEALSPVAKGGFDDSIIQTPPEGVVLRKKKIKKFNTVAYRGDNRPDKWKRASINGHMYNFDTRVFTPVQGSCTSVTVDSTYTTTRVIKTLLEKFKIENKPDEYSLYIVQEKGGEKLLRNSDIPLLERATLGPDELSGAKIFLKDKVTTPRKTSVGFVQVTVPEVVVEEEELPKSPQPRLPEEIETLIAIPEPVLRGILQKFKADEESDIKKIKARYSVAKRKLVEEIAKIKTKM